MELEQFIDHPSGFLALSSHNQRFTITELPGFIAYREQGKHWIFFGGGIRSRELSQAMSKLFWKFGGVRIKSDDSPEL